MAPPRKHQTDVILDATRALVLAEGPRAASVGAIAKASGAPAGTLYHRFGTETESSPPRGCVHWTVFRRGRSLRRRRHPRIRGGDGRCRS